MIRARTGAWVLWLAAAGLLAHTAAEKEERHLRERVRWHTLEELSAAAPNKPALVDFDAPWCRPCWEMKFRVYSRKDVASVIEERFFPVRIVVADSKNLPLKEKRIMEAYGVEAFPTLLVVNWEGQALQMLTGYLDAEQLISALVTGKEFDYTRLPKGELALEGLRELSPKRAKVVLYPAWALSCLEASERRLSYQIFYEHALPLPRHARSYLVQNVEFFEATPPTPAEAVANRSTLCREFARVYQVTALPAALVFSPDGKELLAKFVGDVGPLYPFLRGQFPEAAKRPEGYLRWNPPQNGPQPHP